MGLDRTTPAERAMAVAFADMTSSKVKEMGFSLNSEKGNVMRASDYLLSEKNQDLLKNLQGEVIDLSRLDQVYVFMGAATKGEFKGNGEIALVINMGREEMFKNKAGNPYRDLGIITYDEDTKQKSFIEDNKIKRERKEALGNAVDEKTEENEFEIKTLDDLVEFARKGKRLCPKNAKEVKDRTERAGGTIDEKEFEDLSQDELEKKLVAQQESTALLAAAGIDGGELEGLKKLLKEHGIALEDVKQVTKVESAQVLDGYMKDKRQFSPNGKNTYIISVRNREANAKGDRMITLQDGTINDNAENDKSLMEFKERYGQDSSVISTVEPKEEEFIEYEDSNGKIISRDLVVGEERVVTEDIQERVAKIKEEMENNIAQIKASDFSEPDKKKAISEAYGNGYGAIVNLEMETGVDLPSIEAEFFDDAYDAALSEYNPLVKSDDFGEIEVDNSEKDDGNVVSDVIEGLGVTMFGGKENKRNEIEDDPYARYSQGRLPKHLMD